MKEVTVIIKFSDGRKFSVEDISNGIWEYVSSLETNQEVVISSEEAE